MMGVVRGHEPTEDELAARYTAAGFTLTRVIPTHSMLAIVEGVPA